jgi:hypothetical protein
MSKLLWINLFALFFALGAICQVSNNEIAGIKRLQTCPPNSDRLYDRKKIIKRLGKVLNKSVPENVWGKYGVTDDEKSPAGFFIYDLTDTSNKDITSTGCIEFKDNHVYHFAPFDYAFSLSHIVILENGNLKVFKSINCKGRGDTLEGVLVYLRQKLANEENKEEILERVENYKQYAKHFKMDNYSTSVCRRKQ